MTITRQSARGAPMLVTLILCFGALLLIPTKAHVCPISVLPIMMRPLDVRGGSEGNQSRKKMKKKKPTSKKVIAEAMKEKDAAQALGDAIRYVSGMTCITKP